MNNNPPGRKIFGRDIRVFIVLCVLGIAAIAGICIGSYVLFGRDRGGPDQRENDLPRGDESEIDKLITDLVNKIPNVDYETIPEDIHSDLLKELKTLIDDKKLPDVLKAKGLTPQRESIIYQLVNELTKLPEYKLGSDQKNIFGGFPRSGEGVVPRKSDTSLESLLRDFGLDEYFATPDKFIRAFNDSKDHLLGQIGLCVIDIYKRTIGDPLQRDVLILQFIKSFRKFRKAVSFPTANFLPLLKDFSHIRKIFHGYGI